MKIKITLSSFFLLFTFVSFGQFSPVGHLTIFSESGDKFFLILNGEQQNDIPQTNLRIEDLNQPYYSAKIIFADKKIQEISKNYLPLTDADGIFQDVTYKIKKDKNNVSKMKMNFFSMIPAQQGYVAPANVYVMHYGQPQLNTGINTGINAGVNVGVNMNVNIDVNETSTSSGHSGYDDHAGHDHGNHNHSRGCGNQYAMGPSDFNSAVSAVKKQSFEDSRMKTAQQIVSANCVNVNQIMQLANLFSFENNKLEFAKFAYDYCIDPANYYKLNTIFSFSSNSEALSDYVQSRR